MCFLMDQTWRVLAYYQYLCSFLVKNWLHGVPINRNVNNFYAIDIEDIASRVNLNDFL